MLMLTSRPTAAENIYIYSLDYVAKHSCCCWELANDDSLLLSSLLNDCLCNIDNLAELISCYDNVCHNSDHLDSFENYFDSIHAVQHTTIIQPCHSIQGS